MEGRFRPAVVAPFPADLVVPLDPAKNSGRLVFTLIYDVFFTFSWKMITFLGLVPSWR